MYGILGGGRGGNDGNGKIGTRRGTWTGAGVGVKRTTDGEEGGGGGDRRLADWVVDGGGLFDETGGRGDRHAHAHWRTRLRNFADPAAAAAAVATPRE